MGLHSTFSNLLEGCCPYTTPSAAPCLSAGGFAVKQAGNDRVGNTVSEQGTATNNTAVKEHLHRARFGEKKKTLRGSTVLERSVSTTRHRDAQTISAADCKAQANRASRGELHRGSRPAGTVLSPPPSTL